MQLPPVRQRMVPAAPLRRGETTVAQKMRPLSLALLESAHSTPQQIRKDAGKHPGPWRQLAKTSHSSRNETFRPHGADSGGRQSAMGSGHAFRQGQTQAVVFWRAWRVPGGRVVLVSYGLTTPYRPACHTATPADFLAGCLTVTLAVLGRGHWTGGQPASFVFPPCPDLTRLVKAP